MTVSDDEIIQLLREDGDPAYSTAEVAEMVEMTTDGTRNRLDTLAEEDRLVKKHSSRQCTMWWLPAFDDVTGYPRNADIQPQ